MKCTLLLLAVSCLTLFSLRSFAQNETKKWSIGIMTEIGLPQGDIKSVYHTTSGLSLRFSYHVGPGFITLSAGGVAFIPKIGAEDTSSAVIKTLKVGVQVPVKVGYKYIFLHHIFIMGELGYSTFYTFYEDDNSEIQHSSAGGFDYSLTAGFQLNAFEIGFKYEAFQLPVNNINYIGARLGFNF